MTEHLGILLILAGAALLLTGIWLLRKSKAAGVAQRAGTEAGEHPIGGGAVTCSGPPLKPRWWMAYYGNNPPKWVALFEVFWRPEVFLGHVAMGLHSHNRVPDLRDSNRKQSFPMFLSSTGQSASVKVSMPPQVLSSLKWHCLKRNGWYK